MTDPARRLLLAAAAALPACAGVSAGDPSVPVDSPVARVGDRWRYRLTERRQDRWLDEPTFEVVAVQPELRVAVTGRRGAPPYEERYADAWSVLEETVYGTRMVFDDPVVMVPRPPQPGRSGTGVTRWREPGDARARRYSLQWAVRGRESVEVPAGRFECVRITRVIGFEPTDPQRMGATRTDTLWHAPAVGRWVRRELRGTYVSTGPGAGNPAEGVDGREDWLVWELTAWTPSPMQR